MKSDYCNRIPEDTTVSVIFCQTVFGGTKENDDYCYDSRSWVRVFVRTVSL